MTPSSNPPTHASLKLKTSQEDDNGKKISQFFPVADVSKGFFFIKGRSGEKKQKGIPT
jgi:hypothetical protein